MIYKNAKIEILRIVMFILLVVLAIWFIQMVIN